jgi:hypothetical protein
MLIVETKEERLPLRKVQIQKLESTTRRSNEQIKKTELLRGVVTTKSKNWRALRGVVMNKSKKWSYYAA